MRCQSLRERIEPMRLLAFWLAVASLFFLELPAPSFAAATPDLAKILVQARSAAGGDAIDRASSVHLSGRVTVAGISGTFDQWTDARSFAYAEDDNAGYFTGAEGFDGTNAWDRDWGGVTWIDGGKAGLYAGIATAYLANNSFLRPNQRGNIVWAGTHDEGGVTYDVLRATPPKGLPLEIWLNAKTHLVARAVMTIGIQTTTFTFDSYKRVGSVLIPFHIHTLSDSGNETDAVATAAQVNPPDLDAHIKMATTQPTDFSIANGSETSVPIQLIDNHVYLAVTLNGKGPYQFAFDTGGSNVVDSDVAKQLGLVTSGSMQGSGVGSQTEGFAFAKVATVGIGNATLTNQYFAVLPIRQGFSVAAGVPLDGIIGFEVLSRFVTTFDYADSRVTLRLHAGAAAQPSGADVVPFVFNDTIPQVACQLDGVAGDCSVDTGSRASLTVLTPFSAAHPELIPSNATAPGVNGFGVGGAALGRLGRLGSLQIGATVLPNLIADFSIQQKGYFANPFIAANVGGGVWRRFSVTFDYPNQVMTLLQNAFSAEPDTYDRSGVFLIAPGGQPTVADVRPGTPADEAGLVRGDVLISINGKAAAGMDLAQIRSSFSEPAGTIIHLVVQGKTGSQRSVTLTLRDYV
jgi:PDZ domain/Aspartyl protease